MFSLNITFLLYHFQQHYYDNNRGSRQQAICIIHGNGVQCSRQGLRSMSYIYKNNNFCITFLLKSFNEWNESNGPIFSCKSILLEIIVSIYLPPVDGRVVVTCVMFCLYLLVLFVCLLGWITWITWIMET